ncbi:MAG: T9SS type A sorting domain-containing protein [bacterium]|nr:MAG: T9SS type A sorting domain-containing protein [bacterium]
MMKYFIALIMIFLCYSSTIYPREEATAVLLLVDSTLSPQLGTSYTTYKKDLANEGFIVLEKTVDNSTQPPEIKAIIKEYSASLSSTSEELEGVILIGNLKAPYSIIKTGDYSNPDSLRIWLSLDATDMYYSDLDGDWDHITVDGFQDIVNNPPSNVVELHQEPSCVDFIGEYLVSFDKDKEWDYQSVTDKEQYSIEIWVARIMGHNLSISGKTETDILNDYFTWNHTFRTGGHEISSTCFMLNAIGLGYNDQGMDYSYIFTDVFMGQNVTRETYLTHLQRESGSKLMYLTAHSWPKGHCLSDSIVTASDMLGVKKNSVFYLLNTCSVCRWDEYVSAPNDPNYLGGLYVFDKSHTNGDFGLGAIGFTGVGGFNNLNFFTQYYYNHPFSTYGEMYVYWFNKNLQINFSTHNYVFLGDPTISPDMPLESGSVSETPFLIKEYRLSQNYPNPFNPTTTISFFIPNDTFVTLRVYDVLGKEIETLVSRQCQAGENKVKWNANGLPSGIYFYRFEAREFKVTKKMILQK